MPEQSSAAASPGLLHDIHPGSAVFSRSLAAPTYVKRWNLPGYPYNNCLFRWQDRWLMAFRTGYKNADLNMAVLDQHLDVVRVKKFTPEHPLSAGGSEDPRLWSYRGQLRCSYSGLFNPVSRYPDICMLVAALDDDFNATNVWRPEWPFTRRQEKNWGFFEYDGELHCVYSVRPHVVLKFTDGQVFAEEVSRQDWRPLWRGGNMRGGAPPARCGDEYYCFFHGCIDLRFSKIGRIYCAGCYTFSAAPPFGVRRCTLEPLWWPRHDTVPDGIKVAVVFPAGSVRHGNWWLVSYGLHDYECHLAYLRADLLERALVAV